MEIGIHHALSSSDIRRKKGPEVTSFQARLPVLPKEELDTEDLRDNFRRSG